MARTDDYRHFLDGVEPTDVPNGWYSDVKSLQPKDFEKSNLAMMSLPGGAPSPASAREWAVCAWWENSLREANPSVLNFVMIVRLAELILRANPKIRNALRLTYPFVFLDEFQDTTYPQYALVRTAFMGSASVLTAVGDDKQRIMLWAGARLDAFRKFEEEFAAMRIPLLANYRSTEELVRIQHVVASTIDPGTEQPESRAKTEIAGEVAQIWQFPSQPSEAKGIANRIAADIQAHGLGARDFALLVRQKSDDYEGDLRDAFADCGLRIRNENRLIGKVTIQDLLSEELTRIVLSFLRLGAKDRARVAWTSCLESLTWLRGADPQDEGGSRRLSRDLGEFANELRGYMKVHGPSGEAVSKVLARVMEFTDTEAIRQAVREYVQGDRFEEVLVSLGLFLGECAEAAGSWVAALDILEGLDQVPLMTVHKSKGLEFHTMIFIGLDDQAWWSFAPGDMEGLSTFFVALSRARQRAFFSYCPPRGGRKRIRKLYELLQEAKVPEQVFAG